MSPSIFSGILSLLYRGISSMTRFAAARSMINSSSRTTRPTVGMSLIANVPTLNGSIDSMAWAETLIGAMKNVRMTLSIRVNWNFLIIFSLQCSALTIRKGIIAIN
ncbi:hypothetical protein N9X63_07380 [Woeseiaceae bacterium]|nr:hypothetical protein [Woeseiaceae bacterium]